MRDDGTFQGRLLAALAALGTCCRSGSAVTTWHRPRFVQTLCVGGTAIQLWVFTAYNNTRNNKFKRLDTEITLSSLLMIKDGVSHLCHAEENTPHGGDEGYKVDMTGQGIRVTQHKSW